MIMLNGELDGNLNRNQDFYQHIFIRMSQSAWFESIIDIPENNETNGTLYIHERSGTFHMVIIATAETSYTLVIEQNLVSIPEFQLWAILPLGFTATLLIIFLKERF